MFQKKKKKISFGIYGVDVSEGALSTALRKNPTGIFKKNDAYKYEVKNIFFDVVYFFRRN